MNIPPQRHRCTKHQWCLARVQGHHVHVGEVHLLTTARGTEIRVSLNAEEDAEPVVHMEATFDRGGAMMELAELEATEAIELAGYLMSLGRVAQVERNEVG